MKLTKVEIRNFKAINHVKIDLTDFTVIVGANGSGKSSILQAMHWMFQSGRNVSIEATAEQKGSTLSEKDATYMPSPEYQNASHGVGYGNRWGTSQLDMIVEATDNSGNKINASMWIKSARNEGLSVHVPVNNEFVKFLRDRNKEFSSYIPGLAGIPLSEEKRTKLIVHRQAAAGDANTVLRNVLLLLKESKQGELNGLDIVQKYISSVMDEMYINVEFDEQKNFTIMAEFQTADMKSIDTKRKKPLELAGIGFLQVIQIFSYLVYFRPEVLLVDEPDSHLHPSTQERLIHVLADAAKELGTQVVLATHSPSVMRALPTDASVVWMKGGVVQENGDTSGRQMMGWGLLDKKILLLTEDTKLKMLQSLLSQWPDLARVVAIWPLHGSGKLLDATGCASLKSLFGDEIKIVLHRDRDFMMPEEAKAFIRPYSDAKISVWLTKHSDIESYWAEVKVICSHFSIDTVAAQSILDDAVKLMTDDNKDFELRNKKRLDIMNKIDDCKKGKIGAFSDSEVLNEYKKNGNQHIILGKELCSGIRTIAQNLKLDKVSSFGKGLPLNIDYSVAYDLREIVDAELS